MKTEYELFINTFRLKADSFEHALKLIACEPDTSKTYKLLVINHTVNITRLDTIFIRSTGALVVMEYAGIIYHYNPDTDGISRPYNTVQPRLKNNFEKI